MTAKRAYERPSSKHSRKLKKVQESFGAKLASGNASQTEHFLKAARGRGQKLAREFLDAEGGALLESEVGKILGLAAQEIEKRRESGSLLALVDAEGIYLYPSWQFKQNRSLPGLAEALAELRGHDAWAQLGFFLTGNDRLDGVTPLEELRRGNVEGVCRAASSYGEHGAA